VTLADLVSDGAWNAYYDGFHFPLGKRGAPADAGPTVKGGRWIVMADMRAASLYIASDGTQPAPRDVHYLRGDYGPRLDQCPGGGIKIGSDVTDDTNDPRLMPADITLERLRVHDFTVSRTCAGTHMDCVHVRDVKGYLHLVGNHFAHCQDYAILIDGNGPVPDDILVAGNVVGRNVSGTSSLALHGGAPSDEFNGSVVFRDNSADGLITAQTTNRLSGSIRFTHNNAPSVAPCRDGVSYAGNVTTQGPPCGRSDRLGALDWSARG
jgi:hypothetical protein